MAGMSKLDKIKRGDKVKIFHGDPSIVEDYVVHSVNHSLIPLEKPTVVTDYIVIKKWYDIFNVKQYVLRSDDISTCATFAIGKKNRHVIEIV